MSFELCNYHTHTPRCKHAAGSEKEYIETAVRCGYRALGFTDHMAWPFPNGYISPIRMSVSELPDYAATVHQLSEAYAGKIRVYLGAECEYFPDYLPWLLEQKERFGMDYLILGVHCPPNEDGHRNFAEATTPQELGRYTELAIAGMESGLFSCLCHPDLPLKSYPHFDRFARQMSEELCDAALRLDMPLEFNLAGIKLRGAVPTGHGYTSDEFWEIAAGKGCRAILAADAHQPEALADLGAFRRAREKLEQLGISLCDTLPGLN